MDYLIIAIAVLSGLYFHWWLFARIRRWTDRDLALSLAGEDQAKRDFMLAKLAQFKRERIKRSELEAWLEAQASGYEVPGSKDNY